MGREYVIPAIEAYNLARSKVRGVPSEQTPEDFTRLAIGRSTIETTLLAQSFASVVFRNPTILWNGIDLGGTNAAENNNNSHIKQVRSDQRASTRGVLSLMSRLGEADYLLRKTASLYPSALEEVAKDDTEGSIEPQSGKSTFEILDKLRAKVPGFREALNAAQEEPSEYIPYDFTIEIDSKPKSNWTTLAIQVGTGTEHITLGDQAAIYIMLLYVAGKNGISARCINKFMEINTREMQDIAGPIRRRFKDENSLIEPTSYFPRTGSTKGTTAIHLLNIRDLEEV